MRTTCDYAFYCRASKVKKNGMCHIEVSLSVNGSRKFMNLPYQCKPEDFNKKRKPKPIQDYLDSITFSINTYITEMQREGIAITALNIAEAIQNNGIRRSYTVEDLFNEYNGIMEGKDISYGQVRKYYYTTDEFYNIVDKSSPAEDVSTADILRFQNHIYAKYATNTAAGYIVRIKAYFKYAKDANKISTNPTINLKVKRAQNTNIKLLSDEEMDILRHKDLHIERLNKVRDCWLFQAASGLSYCDMATLTKEDIKEEDGIYYINRTRQKTNTEYTAVILSEGIDILKKYDWKLPVISNQKMNAFLTEIQELCGIKTHWTTHTARHMYCTRLLNAGVRLEVVAKCAGHSDTKITQQFYAKLMNDTIVKEVASKTL